MATTVERSAPTAVGAPRSSDVVVPSGRTAYWLSGALLVVSAVAAFVTFFVDGILLGVPAGNGNARGTALIVLVVAVPVGVVALTLTARGHVRALPLWLGATGYLLYNSLLFLFSTPFNRLFLVSVAMLSLALWSTIAILVQTDVVRFGAHVSSSLPRRGIALYAWAVVALNAMVWLKGAVPAVVSSDPLSIMAGTGLTTNVVYVQDLAFWFPLMTVAAAWLWQGRPWGALLVGSVLTTWLIECIGVATDQWFGHRADPSSSMAAPEMVVVFAVLALVGTVPLVFYYRNINPTGTTSPTGD